MGDTLASHQVIRTLVMPLHLGENPKLQQQQSRCLQEILQGSSWRQQPFPIVSSIRIDCSQTWGFCITFMVNGYEYHHSIRTLVDQMKSSTSGQTSTFRRPTSRGWKHQPSHFDVSLQHLVLGRIPTSIAAGSMELPSLIALARPFFLHEVSGLFIFLTQKTPTKAFTPNRSLLFENLSGVTHI